MDLSDSQALQNEGEGAATLLDGMQIEDPAAGSPVCATPRCKATDTLKASGPGHPPGGGGPKI